uniref:uncharacterized protein LOC120335927 isoform X1 n=1 Tax=Styela clava TaxID=7725 RepID=UPI0019396E7B|nr:uncharacterized protein LOC120335927 isoform X1 [Styela clava]
MRSLFCAVLLALLHFSFQTSKPRRNEKCQYPEVLPPPINWTKLEGKTFYLSLNDGSVTSKEVACVVMTNITAVIGGYRGTFVKYLHATPTKPENPVRLRFITVNDGYYEVLERVAAKIDLPDLVEQDGRINWRKEFEDIHIHLEQPPFKITDYENYVIVIRCNKNGHWYVRPYIRNSVPTANDVLHVWKALHDHGIYLPLQVSECDSCIEREYEYEQ